MRDGRKLRPGRPVEFVGFLDSVPHGPLAPRYSRLVLDQRSPRRPPPLVYPCSETGDGPGPPNQSRAESVGGGRGSKLDGFEVALAALEGVDEDALGPAREQTLKADLPKVQRQLAQVVVAFHEDVEGAAQSWTSLDSVAPRPAYHSSLRFSKANNDSKR